MYEKYYFDTSIWLDFFEKRGKNGENALKLIRNIIENDSIIIYSDANIKELKYLGYSFSEIISMFTPLKRNLRKKIYLWRRN